MEDKGKEYGYISLRKVGRPAIFEEPEQLIEAAEEYFQETAKRKINTEEMVKAGPNAGQKFDINHHIPFTIGGLCLHLGVHSQYFRDFKKRLKTMEDRQKAREFSLIVTRIEEIILTNQIEGAMAGIYNPNLTARLNGITERTDITSDGKEIKTITKITCTKPDK